MAVADTDSEMGRVPTNKLESAPDEIARIIAYWDDFNDWTFTNISEVTISTKCGA